QQTPRLGEPGRDSDAVGRNACGTGREGPAVRTEGGAAPAYPEGAALWTTGEDASPCPVALLRASSTKPNNRRRRTTGMSRVQYPRPLRERRSQERGTSTSRVRTASMRAPCRHATCIAAQLDFPSLASQTALSCPCDVEQSNPYSPLDLSAA